MADDDMLPNGAERAPDGGRGGSVVVRQLHVGVLAAYRRLPQGLKRLFVGWMTPSFQVAAGVIVQRPDGAVLLVRQSYRKGWGLPGGLLKRNEQPVEAAAREAFEELGIDVEMSSPPVVMILPEDRRIFVVFRARLAAGTHAAEPVPRSPEIVEVTWFPPDDLPPLQGEVFRSLVETGVLHRRGRV